jgi:hypothetical protein
VNSSIFSKKVVIITCVVRHTVHNYLTVTAMFWKQSAFILSTAMMEKVLRNVSDTHASPMSRTNMLQLSCKWHLLEKYFGHETFVCNTVSKPVGKFYWEMTPNCLHCASYMFYPLMLHYQRLPVTRSYKCTVLYM